MIDASVYAEGTGSLARLPKFVAYAGVSMLILDACFLALQNGSLGGLDNGSKSVGFRWVIS